MPTDESHELYELGREAMIRGQLDQAIAAFRRSAQLDEHFKTLELLGECLLRVGRTEEAITPLESAVALNRQVRAKSLLAKALAASGHRERASELAEEVLREAPNNRIALAVRGEIHGAG